MKTNKQSKIKINKSGYKRSRFNWAHDVNTTFTWGEIQPTQCKMLIPGSKTTMQSQSLIRLSPMVAPTFGRVKYKTFNQFVPCADIYPNFEQMLAQEPITRNGVTAVPKEIPSISLGQLSAYCFFGARANIYWADNETQAKYGNYKTRYRKVVNTNSTDWLMDSKMQEIRGYFTTANIFKVINNGGINSNVLPHVNGFGSERVVWFPKAGISFLDTSFAGDTAHTTTDTSYGVVLGMKSLNSLFPVDRTLSKNVEPHAPVLDDTDDTDVEVTMEAADYVVEFNIPNPSIENRTYLAIAFELSDYGKRLRKILQGCGYQIDLASTEKVSILPLLAQYKAYFDVFGLQLYEGWETTACAGLIDYITNNFVTTINGFEYQTGSENKRMFSLPCYDNPDGMTIQNSRFIDFMLGEVANEWYTEDPDFIGAHLPQLAVSPKVNTEGFISVTNSGLIQPDGANITNPPLNSALGESEGQNYNTYDGQTQIAMGSVNAEVHSFINQIQHGQVDAELLKRMYRWTNRNTILGREIAKILRAQGFGKYVDECKSNYIGSTDNMITISDVVSMADTKNGDDGSSLGEFGGKGLQYIEDKTLVFENDEYGYWITLATVVPEAGYTQGLDPTLKALDKFNLYNPDFDAIGMEMTTKDTIVGCRYNVPGRYSGDPSTIISNGRKGFGFIPRYSKFKIAHNLVNGDFNRHNRRNIYLPYTLDKQLNVNDYDSSYRYLQEGGTDNSTGYATLNRSATTDYLPIAGNLWRTPTKYNWLGNFNRIFLNSGIHDDNELKPFNTNNADNTAPGFSDYNDDNFLSHGIMDVQCYAPMKTIEDSYGLDDEDADKAGVEFTEKA